jgi:outer membrane protein, heavy metal efflux system
MGMGTKTLAVCAVVCFITTTASAQGVTMTLAEVMARAREHAPAIVSARLAIEEARARLVGASLPRQSNPQVDAAIGNRHGPETRFTDFELAVAQAFAPGSRRSARIAGANAGIAQSAANVDAVTRAVLRETAAVFYRTLHANERIKLLTAAHDLAAAVHSAADRRFRAGDIAVLDVNIARSSLARIRAEREGAEAAKVLALGDLRQLLQLESNVEVDGVLTPPGSADLTAALQASAQRPELRLLEAGIEEAEAETRVGVTFAKPEYGAGVRYAREEGDQIVLGSMTVTLPLFAKGQEQRALGSARAARLRADLEAARTSVHIEVRAAFDAYQRRLAALRLLETEALSGLAENEQLSTRSFEVGQLGLPELLVIRREIFETRFQYLDALLEAALARIDLDASAAILR